MSLPKKVKLVDVSPRDGLQNEAMPVPTAIKLDLIQRLTDSGLTAIEATSFVAPNKIPQLADADELYPQIQKKAGVDYAALVPNLTGLKRAKAVKAKSIAVFCAVSETFSKKNTNCSIAEGLERARQVAEDALKNNIKVRGYISCVLGCPYEGETSFKETARIAKALLNFGCNEVSLGDTIGVGTPGRMQQLLETLFAAGIAKQELAVHCHDTYGQALVNIYAALESGIAVVDASVAGLGGCPYAKGASGNVATEDVLYMLNGLGIETGVDLRKLVDVGHFISDYLKRQNNSKVGVAFK